VNSKIMCSGSWLAEHEYVIDDVNRWWFLARGTHHVGASNIATHGDLDRSARHRSCEGMGTGDELRASFVLDGIYWGAAGFLREEGDSPFTSRDVGVLTSLTDVIGEQALDRTQPSLPMKKGRAATMTHDYKRNGTTTLFAALDVLTGTVIGQCLPRHRHEEFLKFLRTIEREVPAGLAVHLICDNYATHKNPAVRAWLAKHPPSTCTSPRPHPRG